MVRLISEKRMNRVVSHLPEVHKEVLDVAVKVGAKAKAKLAAHTRSGDAQVSVTDGDVDAFVNLDDEAAMSIEFGHWTRGESEDDQPKRVKGLYIITGAAGLRE